MDTFIIVIQGVGQKEYEEIKKDILYQMGGKPECLFCLLPGEYPEVSIVWISKELEKDKVTQIIKNTP